MTGVMELTDFGSDDDDDDAGTAGRNSTHTRTDQRQEQASSSTGTEIQLPHASQTDFTPQPTEADTEWDGDFRTHAPVWDDSQSPQTPTGPRTQTDDAVAWVADLPEADKPTHQGKGKGNYWEPLVEPFHGASLVRPDSSLAAVTPENGQSIPADAIAYVVDGKRAYLDSVPATRVRVPQSYAALSDMTPEVDVQTLRSPERALGVGSSRCEQLIRLLNGSGRFDAGAVSVYTCGQYPNLISVGSDTLLFTSEPVEPPTRLAPPDWVLTNGSVDVAVPEATQAGKRALSRLQSAFAQFDCELIQYDGTRTGTSGHRFGIDPVTAGFMDTDTECPVSARTGAHVEPAATAWSSAADTGWGESDQTPEELAEEDEYVQVAISADSICRAGAGYSTATHLHEAIESSPTISDQHCAHLPEAPYERGETIATEDATIGERDPVVLSIDYSPPTANPAHITSRTYGQYVYQLLVDDSGYTTPTHKVVTDSIPVTMQTPDGITRVPTDRPAESSDVKRDTETTQFTSRL